MELLQLRYFYEPALAESFAVTAEKYMVPATSVSASVKRLEQELGCSLFDRSANRIRLNENGRRLQKSLCLVFSELEGAVETGDKACYERLIASGIGVGLGRGDTPPAGCAYLPVSDFDERYTVYVYYKPDARFGNVELFLDFLQNGEKALDKRISVC